MCVRLGIWQLDRLDQRRAFNDEVTSRGELSPQPLQQLIDEVADIEQIEHRRVEVAGRYDAEREILVVGSTLDDRPGMEVVTPLVTSDGQAVLVDRGFVPVVDPNAVVPAEAKPPRGGVEVVGVFRTSERGRFSVAGDEEANGGTIGHATGVDVERIATQLPYDLAPGYVRIEAERNNGNGLPVPLRPADVGEGPHLSYAAQWFSFAVVFLVGWPILIRRTARQRQRHRTGAAE